MKKWFLGIAALALVVGVVLMGSGWAMGAQTELAVDFFGYPMTVGMTGFGHRGSSSETSTAATQTVSESDMAAFQYLDVDMDLGDVIFLTADSYGLDMEWYGNHYELHYTNKDGRLKIWSTSIPNIGVNVGTRYGGTVTVYLPQDVGLRDVNVETDLGTADLRGFRAESLTVKADLGDVSLSDIEADRADLTLSLGSLTTAGFSTNKSLNVEADLGDVQLFGAYRGTVEINADLGSVVVDTDLSRDEYSYDLSADLGSVYVDGEEQKDEITGGNGGNSITVHADLGDIDLNFR